MQAQSDLTQQENNKLALVLMLLSVVLYSAAPLVFSISNANNSPFLFVALMNFSSLISGLVFLIWFHRTKRENKTVKETLGIIYSKIYTKAFFWVFIAIFQDIFFAMSLSYINVAVATILLATKPFFTVLIIAWLFKEVGRYKKLTIEKWLLFILAFIVSLVLFMFDINLSLRALELEISAQ